MQADSNRALVNFEIASIIGIRKAMVASVASVHHNNMKAVEMQAIDRHQVEMVECPSSRILVSRHQCNRQHSSHTHLRSNRIQVANAKGHSSQADAIASQIKSQRLALVIQKQFARQSKRR